MNKVKILDVEIDNISCDDLLHKLSQGGVVLTPNIDHLVKLQTDVEFYQAYQAATYRVCDSQILLWTSRIMRIGLKEKISGSDFFPRFCEHYKDDPAVTIFLLGAAEGVAAKAQQRINHRLGRNLVIDTHSPSYSFLDNEDENQEIIDRINRSGATVLAIGVGAPKQEKWLYRYRHRLPNIKVALAVGATIDFEAGHIKRAPKWVSESGLEWLYRLATEPGRLWKRYLVDDLTFFGLLIKHQLQNRSQKNSASRCASSSEAI